MNPNCVRIEALVVQMQDAFLETPALKLTLSKAQKRFGVDAITCEAIMDTLVDAGVLTRAHDGAYLRLFPQLVGRAPANLADGGRAVAQHAA